MRLTFYSDYSLRLLMYVAVNPDKLVTVQEVADAYGISKNHLMKIVHQLGQHGFVKTVRGRNGGIRLARAAAKIGLGQVVRITEEDFTMVECFDAATNMCAITRSCRLRGVLHTALEAFFAVLDEYTLADLANPHSALARTLIPA